MLGCAPRRDPPFPETQHPRDAAAFPRVPSLEPRRGCRKTRPGESDSPVTLTAKPRDRRSSSFLTFSSSRSRLHSAPTAGKRGVGASRPEKPRDNARSGERSNVAAAGAKRRAESSAKAEKAFSKKSAPARGAALVTPRFWDKAAALAEETLGTLSPGSRRRLSEIASTKSGAKARVEGADSPSLSPRREKKFRGAALTVPDLLVPSGVAGVSGLSSLAIPSPSETAEHRLNINSPHLGDLPSALGVRRSPRGGRAEAPTSARGDVLSATGSPKTLLGRRGNASDTKGTAKEGIDKGTNALMVAGGGPVKKRRPPRLTIANSNASPLLENDEAGTPLLGLGTGGHVVGDVPGLRGSARTGSMTLRKAVLERWGGIPTPREQDMALTPNDVNIAISPTQFLTTPR